MAISFSRQSSAPALDAVEAEELAYMLLEEARLRIESLASRDHGSLRLRSLRLRRLHRHLGLAGYHCSAELPTPRRLRQLTLAHERAAAAPDGSLDPNGSLDPDGSLDAAVTVTVRAIAAVEDALVASGLAGHVQEALVDAITACECFDALHQAAW